MLMAINEAFVDDAGVPIQNIRVRHTIVLEDPFPDPPALAEHVPEKSPEPAFAQVLSVEVQAVSASWCKASWTDYRSRQDLRSE